MKIMQLLTRLLFLLLPGGGILQAVVKASGGPAPDLSKPVDIFDITPYKQQVWQREHPGQEYPGDDKVDQNGNDIPQDISS